MNKNIYTGNGLFFVAGKKDKTRSQAGACCDAPARGINSNGRGASVRILRQRRLTAYRFERTGAIGELLAVHCGWVGGGGDGGCASAVADVQGYRLYQVTALCRWVDRELSCLYLGIHWKYIRQRARRWYKKTSFYIHLYLTYQVFSIWPSGLTFLEYMERFTSVKSVVANSLPASSTTRRFKNFVRNLIDLNFTQKPLRQSTNMSTKYK